MPQKLAHLVAGACMGALLAGCGGGAIGMDDPGLAEQMAIGRAAPEATDAEVRQTALGFAIESRQRRLIAGERREELVRAVVDGDGKVVAWHAMRSWRRRSWLKPNEQRRRFTLEAQLDDPVPTTQPADVTGPDEALLAFGKAMGLGQTPRPKPPQSWPQAEPSLLGGLNERRQRAGLPPAGRLARDTGDLLAVAEMLLEWVPADGAEAMERTVWGELNLTEALRKAARHLPSEVKGTFTWTVSKRQEDKGFSLTLAKLPVVQLAEDRYQSGGSLTNLGAGRVRLVLESHFSHGAPAE